jgi:hypothetical protein
MLDNIKLGDVVCLITTPQKLFLVIGISTSELVICKLLHCSDRTDTFQILEIPAELLKTPQGPVKGRMFGYSVS